MSSDDLTYHTMWHLNVPKVLHLYWGLTPMHPLRWKTVTSFRALNPDWRVILHRPTKAGMDPGWDTGENKWQYTGPCAIDPSMVEIVTHDMPDMSDVHRSDILRWRLLSTVGGVWSDTDIVYVRPMEELACNTKEHQHATTFLSWWGGRYHQRIGFLMSSENNPFFTAIHDMALGNCNQSEYQSGGAEVLNCLGLIANDTMINMGRSCVYPLIADQIFDFSSMGYQFERGTIGLHWFAGHPLAAKYMKIKRPHCIMDKI